MDHTARRRTQFSMYTANFGVDNLISAGDKPPKLNSEKMHPGQNSTSSFKVDALRPSGTFVCVIVQNFSQIRQLAAEL